MAYIPRLVRKKLGEILLESGRVKEEQVGAALELQRKNGKALGEILVEMNAVREEDIAFVLSRQYGLPYLDASKYMVQGDCKSVVPGKYQFDNRLVVLDKIGDMLIIATSGVIDTDLLDKLEQKAGCPVWVYISTQSQVMAALKKYYSVG